MAMHFPADFREVQDGIVYRTATEAELEAVLSLLMREFFPHMALFVNPPTEVPEDMVRGFLEEFLPQRVSLLAEDAATGELVGARINGVDSVAKRAELPEAPATYPEAHRRCWQILEFVKILESKVDCFQRFNIDTALTFKMVVVQQSYGRRQIGRTLNQIAIRLAASCGLRMVTGSTESYYSQRMNESLGFQAVHRVTYKDYVVPGTVDERPFVAMDATVHKEAVMFVLLLDNSSQGTQ